MNIGIENEILEFKETTAEVKEATVSMVAILNKHGSGELYFGVKKNGTVVGQMVSEKSLRDVSQAVGNYIKPAIYPRIEKIILDNRPCIKVDFAGDDAPYFADGKAYIRTADEDKVMSPAQIEAYILRKNAGTDAWDKTPSEKVVDDIEEEVLKEYVERGREVGRISFEYKSKLDTLTRLETLKNGYIANAAAVYFSRVPLLEIQMAIFATTERKTFLDIQREGGSVQELSQIAEKYILSNIRWRVEFPGSLQRDEIPEIPKAAIREAVLNSYCHRDYKSSQNNEICIYSNRVEIYNPGTFPEGLTPEDFINGLEKSVQRNPLLAQLMYYVRDVETFGTGLKRITEACDEAGIKVEFRRQKRGFAVVFYRPEIFANDEDTAQDTTQDTTQDAAQDERVIAIIKYCEIPRTRDEIQNYIGITNRSYFRKSILKPLLDSNKLNMTIPEKPNSKYQKYVSNSSKFEKSP